MLFKIYKKAASGPKATTKIPGYSQLNVHGSLPDLLVTWFTLCIPLYPQEVPLGSTAFVTSWQQVSILSLEKLLFFFFFCQ